MTNEEVMQLMTDMDLHDGGMENWKMDNAWVAFANKVAEREREACAKVCEEVDAANKGFPLNAKTYAAAIRARGEK